MNLPLSEGQVALFVGYLLKEQLAASTIESYLSGLRQAHIAAGYNGNCLRSDFIKQVIRGRKNQAISNSTTSQSNRLPITPAILALMKKHIKDSNLPKERKLLIWCIATVAFHGGFRIHEILPQKQNCFDPLVTLLNKDISVRNIKIENNELQILQIKLKSEKTNKTGSHTLVDIYQSSTQICPMNAFLKWSTHRSCAEPNLPAFRDETGKPYTGRRFNIFLNDFMETNLPNIQGKITSHSFRAGIATLLGTLGYSDEEIKSTGRWSSQAFLEYLKMPRSKRLTMAREISGLKM